MKNILLLIKHQQNRNILSQWLTDKYNILLPKDTANFAQEGKELLTQNFDLCLVDFAAIQELRQQMIAKRELVIPLFLPFVFLTLLQDVGISTDSLEPLIDDIIYLPTKKIELETKLRVLLRSRSYSLQLQKAQEELNQALIQEKELNELKSKFLSMVSHEFRNPLNGISGMTQLLTAYGEKLSSEKKVEILASLQRNVTKMNNLIDDVLQISREDMTQIELNPAPLDLESFCQNIINEIQTAFDNKQSINLIFQQQNKQQVNLDKKIIHYILINLLSNACKYSEQNSIIDLEVSCKNSEIIFIVRDRGMGIPSADIPRLFDSFYRASNSAGYQGTGLGLAIVKQYVELHQGTVSVNSELNVGTTFTVKIKV